MPFGYLEFSRAIGREPCPIMRARAAAGGGGGGRPAPAPVPGPGRARVLVLVLVLGLGLGSLPGLVLFESGLKGMGRYPNQTRSAPPTDPLRCQVSNRSANRCQTSWTANGCEPVGLPTDANLLDCQRLRTCWTAKGCSLSFGFEPVGPSWSAI